MPCQTCRAEQAPTTPGCPVCRTPVGAPAVIPGARTYRLGGIGRWATNLIGLMVVADVLIAVLTIMDSRVVRRAAREFDSDAIDTAMLSTDLVRLVLLAPAVAVSVLVIIWCYQARVNLDAFPGAMPTLGRGWAIAGWLVPFAYFVVPPRVMANIARDSLWRSTTPAVARIWIGIWLVYGLAITVLPILELRSFLALPMQIEGTADYQMYVDYYTSFAVPSSLLVAAFSAVHGVSLILLIKQVSAAQDARIGRGVPAVPVMSGMPVARA